MASLTDCQKSPVQPRMCRQAGRFVLFRVDGDLLPPLFFVLQLGVQIGVHPLEAGQHPLDLLAVSFTCSWAWLMWSSTAQSVNRLSKK